MRNFDANLKERARYTNKQMVRRSPVGISKREEVMILEIYGSH